MRSPSLKMDFFFYRFLLTSCRPLTLNAILNILTTHSLNIDVLKANCLNIYII